MALYSRVNDDVADAIFAAIPSPRTSVMVFGSVARGDASAVSDVDVLELSKRSSRSYKVGRVHVYPYSESHLRKMAAAGSLFVLHLKREGLILRDSQGTLAECLAAYVAPHTYEPYRKVLRATANLLDVDSPAYFSHWRDYNDLAIFVLRTALYIRFAEMGQPVFSLAEIARRLEEPDVTRTLELKNAAEPDFARFSLGVRVIATLLNSRIRNEFGTIEALVTNEGLENPPLLAFGLRFLGHPSPALGYDLLTFSPLG